MKVHTQDSVAIRIVDWSCHCYCYVHIGYSINVLGINVYLFLSLQKYLPST